MATAQLVEWRPWEVTASVPSWTHARVAGLILGSGHVWVSSSMSLSHLCFYLFTFHSLINKNLFFEKGRIMLLFFDYFWDWLLCIKLLEQYIKRGLWLFGLLINDICKFRKAVQSLVYGFPVFFSVLCEVQHMNRTHWHP